MLKNEQQLQTIIEAQVKLQKMSERKRKLVLNLSLTQKAIEELDKTDEEIVIHVIDSILIPRDKKIVKNEMVEKMEFLHSQLKALKEEWDDEYLKFKQMNAMGGNSLPTLNDYVLNR